MVTLNCTYSKTGERKPVLLHVIETRSSPLWSLQTSLEFGLIQVSFAVESQNSDTFLTKQKTLRDFPDLFNGIGAIPGPCKIHLKHDAIPVIHSPRKTPIALRDKVKAELDRMEN